MTVRLYYVPHGEYEDYEFIAEFENGSFTFGGDQFGFLEGRN